MRIPIKMTKDELDHLNKDNQEVTTILNNCGTPVPEAGDVPTVVQEAFAKARRK